MTTMAKVERKATLDATFKETYKKLMEACTDYMMGKDVDMEEMEKMLDLVGRYREQYGYQVPEFELPYRIVTGSIKRGCFHA